MPQQKATAILDSIQAGLDELAAMGLPSTLYVTGRGGEFITLQGEAGSADGVGPTLGGPAALARNAGTLADLLPA